MLEDFRALSLNDRKLCIDIGYGFEGHLFAAIACQGGIMGLGDLKIGMPLFVSRLHSSYRTSS